MHFSKARLQQLGNLQSAPAEMFNCPALALKLRDRRIFIIPLRVIDYYFNANFRRIFHNLQEQHFPPVSLG
jgi:hypothetical protein